jgi:hypothetical protein
MKALYIRIYLPYLILKCIFFKYVYFQVSYYNNFTSVHKKKYVMINLGFQPDRIERYLKYWQRTLLVMSITEVPQTIDIRYASKNWVDKTHPVQ